jgi:hypothetical protein
MLEQKTLLVKNRENSLLSNPQKNEMVVYIGGYNVNVVILKRYEQMVLKQVAINALMKPNLKN